jgi:hypothetical protein
MGAGTVPDLSAGPQSQRAREPETSSIRTLTNTNSSQVTPKETEGDLDSKKWVKRRKNSSSLVYIPRHCVNHKFGFCEFKEELQLLVACVKESS